MKVLDDFPKNKFQLKYAFCADFSLNDEYLAVGNDEGKVLLYRNFN